MLPEKDDHNAPGARDIADRLMASLGSMLLYWYHWSHHGRRIVAMPVGCRDWRPVLKRTTDRFAASPRRSERHQVARHAFARLA